MCTYSFRGGVRISAVQHRMYREDKPLYHVAYIPCCKQETSHCSQQVWSKCCMGETSRMPRPSIMSSTSRHLISPYLRYLQVQYQLHTKLWQFLSLTWSPYKVCPPGLHISLGIFQRLFDLLEAECHNLDLQYAEHYNMAGDPTSFAEYARNVQQLASLQKQGIHGSVVVMDTPVLTCSTSRQWDRMSICIFSNPKRRIWGG